MYMCAGVAFFALDRHTFRSIHFPYPQYATPYSPIVTTTHRNGVDRMPTTVPPPASPNPHARSCRGDLCQRASTSRLPRLGPTAQNALAATETRPPHGAGGT